MAEIVNAKITSVSITIAGHGCLTFWVTLDGDDWGANVGGYCIGHRYLGLDKFDSTGLGLEAMMRIMDTVGVSRWEDLKGQYVRAEIYGWGGTVTKIGNILKDKWFDIDEFFKKNQKD